MYSFILIVLTALANLVYSGLVYPDTSRPIEPFRNNVPASGQTVLSDYTFNFKVQTPSSNYPIMRITFPALPSLYSLTLNSIYVCSFTQSSATITEECIIEANNVVRFPRYAQGSTSFKQITSGSASLVISSISNPAVTGGIGTGMFAISTYSQANVEIDNNDNFGSIGLAVPFSNFPSVSISNDGASIAGYVTNYILQFTNAVALPQGSWFRLQFPSGYGFGTTLCAFLSPSFDITCSNRSSYLYLTGLSQALPAGTYRIRLRNIQNPYSKGSQTGFLFESLKQGTNTVIEQSSSMNSITITAGAITSPSITASPLNKNLRVDYTISFTPSNTIPQGGSIQITFPNTYGSLDSACRVIRGLTATSAGLVCTASSSTGVVTISGFTETPPQFIQIKIYAVNPNIIGPTPQFAIASFRTFPSTATSLIDENTNAGQVSIVDVDNPFLIEIDVYTPYTNTSLGAGAPLDFRLYVKNILPATTGGGFGQIWLQIPLWWSGISTNYRYRCNFGKLDSGDVGGCGYYNQYWKMSTPVNSILSQCDVPISLDYVRVTPIPGRWDFRVLTFINSTAAPIEQDLWTMDIPADPLASATGYSTTLDQNNTNAILRVTFNTRVIVPIEGCINFNMSTLQDVYANTAAWDPTLGFNYGTQNFTSVSCRIVIGTEVVGFAGTTHPKANCVAYKAVGNSTNAVIQIRGWSGQLNSGTLVSVDVPNVKICGDVGMKCVFELTTAYTTTLDNPYTLNYLIVNLGLIQSPYNPVTGTVGVKPTFTPTMICLDADYTFTITPLTTLTQANSDHVLIKFPAAKFTFRRDLIGSNSGNVAVIYVFETDEIYFLIKLTSTLASGGARTVTLTNVRNSNGEKNTLPRVDDFAGVVTKCIYWGNYKEIEQITFIQTDPWTDGGIYNTAMTYYPNVANNANNPAATFTRNLNLGDLIPFSITFQVCHIIPSNGGIKIDVPVSSYQYVSTACQARSGLTGQTNNNGFTTLLNCSFNGSALLVTGFQQVSQFSTITIGFSVKSKTTATTPGNYYITTFYDSAFTWLNDWISPSLPAPVAINGPRKFPLSLDFVDWLAKPKLARVGTLGGFRVQVNMSVGLPAWTASNDAHILFKMDTNMSITAGSYPECRHNGNISYHCQVVAAPAGTFNIKMPTNQFNGIAQKVGQEVLITTLGAYNSSNYDDGIYFNRAGRFTLTAEAYNGGSMTESSQLEFEVFGKDFLKYWVYSFNKGRGGLTLIRIFATLNPNDIFPSSEDPVLKGLIVLEFSHNTTNGFASDLGTGIADKGAIPCNSNGLPILSQYADISCTLIVGLYNNPTRIEISGFNLTNQSANPNFEIIIPKIYNPYSAALTFDVPDVVTRIYEVDIASGDKNELFYHNYDLINVTYPQSPAPTAFSISTAPTVSLTKLSANLSTLSISIKPSYTLSPADHVVIELPLFWKPTRAVTCNVGGNTVCEGHPDANWIVADITTSPIGTGGTTATFVITNPPAMLPPTAVIKAYYYHAFKLQDTVTYPTLGTSLIPFDITDINITSSDGTANVQSSFVFSFITPQPIPAGGAIYVKIPSAYIISDPSCENDAIGGSQVGDKGFQCSIDATGNLVARGFPAVANNSLVVITARLTNPAATTTATFLVQTHYIYQAPPLNTLIATVSKAATVTATAAVSYWDTQYRETTYLYATDIGPVKFLINFPTTLATTDYVRVNVPAAFGLAPNGQPYCSWDNVAAFGCAWASNVITLSSPNLTALTSATNITLKLSTLNADSGLNGLAFPTTAGTYQFTVTSYTSANVLKEQQVINVVVYAKKFTVFYSTTEIINYNMKTSIKVQFQPETAVPVGGKLILYVPTRNAENGLTLFDNDLRSGIADGGSIACHDVGASFGFEPTCTLKYGNQQLGTPAQITVSGWTAPLAVTSNYTFRVNQIWTPAYPADDKHVVMRLESWTSTTVINAGLHYDFTIQKFDPTVYNSPWTPQTAPMNADQSGSTFTVNLYSTQLYRHLGVFDYFIVEFPALIQQPLGLKCVAVTNVDCVSLPGNNWVFYQKSDVDVAAGNDLSTLILNAKQVSGIINSTSSVFNSYAVRNRVAVTKVVYPAIDYSSLTVQTITATVTAPSITAGLVPNNAPVQLLMTFTIPSGSINIVVPSTGALQITLPTTVTAVDNFCTNDASSGMTGSYSCTLNTVSGVQSYSITGFDQLNYGTTVAISFWGLYTPTTSATPAFGIALYKDAAMTIKISNNAAVSGPTFSAYKGFQKIYPMDTNALNPFTVRANDIAPFNFYVTLSATTVTSLTVTFPTSITVPTGASLICGWGTYEAKSCTFTSSPLTVTLETPHTPALTAGTAYKVFITTTGATGTNLKGLSFSTAGKTAVTVATSLGETLQYPIEVFATDFSSLVLNPLWSNPSPINNYLAVALQASTAIPKNGKIVFHFPQTTLDGLTTLFAADLGTGLTSGSTISCSSETLTTFVPLADQIVCTLYYVTGSYSKVEVTGFDQVLTSSAIELFFGPFKNPAGGDNAHVHLTVHTEDASGNILNRRTVFDVFTSQTVTPTTTASSYLRTGSGTNENTLLASPITYAFSSLAQTKPITTRSTIVIQFPVMFALSRSIGVSITSGGTGTSISFKTYANYIVVTPTSDFPNPTGAILITVSLMTNPISQDTATATNVHVFFVYYRSYEVDYNCAATAWTAGTITFSTFTPSQQATGVQLAGTETDFYFEITTTKIPKGGALQVTLPSYTNANAFGSGMVSSGFTAPVTVSSTATTVTFILGRAYDPSVNGTIKFRVTANTPTTAGSAPITVKAFYDSNVNRLISQGTQALTTTGAARTAATSVLITAGSYAQVSTTAPIEISYTLAAAPAATVNEVHVSVGTFTYLSTPACTINGGITAYCGLDSSTGLLVIGVDPTNPLTAVTIIGFSLTAPSTAGIGRLYISYATVTRATSTGTSIGAASATTYANSGTVGLVIYTNDFNSLTITPAHLNTLQPTFMRIQATIGSTAAPSPVFYVDLPRFPATLGLDTALGTTVPCQSSVAATVLTCTLESSLTSWKYTRVKVVGYPDLVASASVDFRIFRITNPSVADDYEIGVKLVSLAVGNAENNLYGGSSSFTFIANTPSTGTGSLSLSGGYVVRAVSNYATTFSLSAAISSALIGSSTIFYHLPYYNYVVTPSSTATCSAGTCGIYDKAGVVVLPGTTGAGAAANSINNLNNPSGVPAATSPQTVVSYLVNSNKVMLITTYTPASAWTAASITGAALTPLSAGQGTGYTPFYLTFTLVNSVPAGGVIRLTLPTSAFTTPGSVVATSLKIVSGTYTGTLSLSTTTSPSVYIDIKGFTSFSAGAVSLYVSINQVKTQANPTGSSVTSYLDSAATIAIDTATISWTVTAASQFRLYNNYDFVIGMTNTVKGGTGLFSFTFKQSASTGSLSSSSSRLRVIPPSTFPFTSTLPIRCKFTDRSSGTSYLSQECYKDGSANYVIYPPTGAVTLAVSEWQVTIFTVGSDIRGIDFPAGASNNVRHVFTVSIETLAATPVTIETNIMRFRLFNNLATTGFVDTYLNNINEKNLVRFSAKLANAVTTSGLIYIEFPMVDPTGTINAKDLNTGLVFRNTLACIPKVGGSLITANCRLIPGNVYEQKPTIIAIDTLSSAISAGTVFDVAIPIVNGATVSVWTSARLTTYDSASAVNLLDFYNFEYVTYTSNPTAVTETATFPTFTVNTVQSLMNFPLTVSPTPITTLLASNSRIRVAYNSFMYGSTQGVTSHTLEQWSTSLAFITFGSNPGSTPQSFTMTNFKNPVSIAPYTSALVANIIQKKVIYSTTSYTSTPPTPTAGTFTSATMTQDSLLRGQVAQYQVSFVLDKAIPVSGGIYFTFPTGYTLVDNSCAITGVSSTTCSVNGLSVYYGGFSAVAAASTLTIYVNAKNPATAGSTGTFTLTSEDAANYTISTRTVPAVTISSTLAFNYLINLPLKTDAKIAQAIDYSPLTFTVLLVNSLAMGNTRYIDFLFPTATPESVLPPTTLLGTDLVCRWGTLAASDCQRVTNGYRVFTPMMTNLVAGTNYTVKITTNRNWNKGFKYPVVGSYAVTAMDSSGGSIPKQFTVPNEAFDSAYIVSRITTNNRHTMLYLRFTPRYDINPESSLTRGQVIVELPTLLSNGRTVFPVDLGKGINNGDSVDCVSNQAFNCKISKGGVSVSAPTSIIMDPQLIVYNYTDVQVKLAWVQTAYNDNTYSPLRVYFRSYDPATSKWTVIEELLKDNIFYTTLSTIDVTQSNLAAPVFNPNSVGAPSTVTWNFNLQNTLTTGTYDRLIIFSNTTNISVQTTGVNCASATVTTHTIAQWYEVAPTVNLASSGSFSLTFTNWTNVPYVISGGIKWYIYVWQGTNLKQIIIYQNTATVAPHAFQPTPSITAFNTKVRAVSTYEISFLPFNPIPAGGFVQVGIPKEYMAVNPECTIQGLTGATCAISDDGDYSTDDYKFVTLKGFNDYFPAVDGTIKLELKLINPKIGGSIGPFTLTTNYTGGYIIDQTTNLGYITIDASATFYEFSLNSLQQLQTKTCGGRPGPMKIKFSLANSLNYPTDFITITLDNAFSQPPVFAEVLCYFIYNDIYNLKTHRCDWTGNQIFVYAPEEKNFVAGDVITLVVTTRGADIKYYDGVSVPSVPGQYFVRVTTSNNLEEAYPIAYIPACPFNRFFGDSAIWNAGSNTLLNFYVNSTAALPSSANGGRIVVEVPTHNEIHSTFTTDLGSGIPAGNTSKAIGCGSGCANCPYGAPLQPATVTPTAPNMQCTLMQADGQNWGDRAVILTTNLQAIPINTYYNFQIGRIMNPTTSGWPYWSHIRIRTQMKAADGSYIDLNDHWAYFIVPTYAPTSTVSAVGGPAPGWPSSTVYAPGNVTFQHTNPTGTMDIGDYLIYEFYPKDFLLPNDILCDQNYNVSEFRVVRCAAMRDSSWIGTQIQMNYSSYRNIIYTNMRQPYYVVAGGIKTLGYEVHNHLIYKVIDFTAWTNGNNNMEVVMQTPSNTNDVSLTLKYQIGVFLWTGLSYVKYVSLTMPSDFVNPNSCVPRRGLILQDVNNPYLPIQCVITPLGGTLGYTIEVFNFTLGDTWFILDITVTNPATPRFTKTWSAFTLDNYNGTNTNYTRIMDARGNSDGRTWVGVKPFPTLFRVYRNTVSFYNRLAKEGQWGEVDMRLITKKDIPAGSGSIQIWLPDEYNIANGGDAVCTIGNNYHTDLDSGSCTITSDRKVYMNTNSATGIPAGTCSLITATTINSANNNNGFQMPAVAGSYPFQVFMYNGTNLQEYSNPGASVNPDPLTSLTVRVVHKETSAQSVVRVIFASPITIPAGYDTATNVLDAYSKPAIGSITIDFNTLDNIAGSPGWPLDVGRGGATDIPCKVFSGLTIRSGYSNIVCTLTISSSANPKNPARVTLSNFEQVVTGTTNIEVHFMNLQNPPIYYNQNGLALNNGRISVGAYETFGDGSTTDIIQSTNVYQPPLFYVAVIPQTWTYAMLGATFISPNTVGSTLIVNFPYNTTINLTAGDVFKFIFPTPQFDLPVDGSLSAVVDGVQLTPYVYEDKRINEIHFEIPAGYGMACNNTVAETKIIKVSQLLNMAYAASANYQIELWVIKSGRRVERAFYSGLPPAIASAPNSLSLVLSSLFSGDVYVTYNFTIVPSYTVPAGSTFTINLPSPQYDFLYASNPSMICSLLSSAYLTNCGGSATPGTGTTITFTALTDIAKGTSLGLQLTGVKNPSFVGTLAAGAINMIITHPNGKLINKGDFSAITFTSPKAPGKISLDVEASSYYKSVDADYTFSIQNSNSLPVGGKIIMNFAADWAAVVLPSGSTITSLTGSFTTSTLYYTANYNSVTGVLTLTTQFTWPAKTSIYIKINDKNNPSLITTTQVFRGSTSYDGVTLDQTDPLDESTTITFETPPPALNVISSSIYPTNEGELATYNFTLSPVTAIPAGSLLSLIFPETYGPLLTSVDANIKCSSVSMPTLTCSVVDGKLVVNLPDGVAAAPIGKLDLVITGITNPNSGTTGAISLMTTTPSGNATLQYASKVIPVSSTTAPQSMDLTKLTTSSTNLQAQATYQLCGATAGAIPANAQVFINFPQQFTLRQPSYVCSTTPDNNALNYPSGPTCVIQNNIRRFVFTGQDNSLPGGTLKSLCYQIKDVENPADSGETNSFSMEVFDPATSRILYRSYGTLSFPTTLTYKRVGLRIIVSSIPDFVVGLMSDYINIQLERSVPYEVVLKPTSPGFTFDPATVVFTPGLSTTQKFRIVPDDTTAAGAYFITWNKTEDSSSTRFAEVADSYFNYVATAAFNKYKVIIGTTVSRTALKGTSLPISVTLTQSPAKNLTVSYITSKPSQPGYMTFSPEELVFKPGELTKTFQYHTGEGAVSGLILFSLDSNYSSIYYMETDTINVEILDIDTEPPEVLNEYIVTMDRTYMYYRISTSESAWVYYLLTLKGTIPPPIDEIKDPSLRVTRGTKTDVIEITGKNSSYQADLTTTYIYYDNYLKFTGLEEQTDYVLYYVVEDLSGNDLSTRKIEFTTFKKHQPVMFNVLLSNNTDTDSLEAAFSLVTGMETSRWNIVANPPKFDIAGNDDPLVQAILDAGTVTYNIMLLQDITADEKRPIEIVSLLETNKYLLLEEIPEIVSDYNINEYSYEVLQFPNEITYQPLLVEVDEDFGTLNVSLKRNGTLFGVVLPKGSTIPSARQIKYGLDATNFKVDTYSYVSVKFEYAETLPYGVSLNQLVSFKNLFDNTEYEAHFIGQNTLPVNPDLMSDDDIMTVSFVTQRELFVIPDDYQASPILEASKLLIFLLAGLLLLL